MANLKTLVGSKFSLIPFKEEHISDTYIGWLNNPEINQFLEVRLVRQTYETVLAYVRSFYGDTEKYMWGIYPNGVNEMVGTATLYDINRHHGRGVVGLMIGEKDYWGKGYGTETIKLIVDYAFRILNLHKVTAGAVANNQGSVKAFQKAGFEIEGTLKSHFFYNGAYYDSLIMGRVNKDTSGMLGRR